MGARKKAGVAKRGRQTTRGAKASRAKPPRRPPPKPVARPLPPPDASGHRFWLVKSEADVYPIEALERDGKTSWNGVRNFAARNHLAAMRAGDRVLYYHSNADPSAIVGVAEVSREAYPDPSQFDRAAGEMGGFDPKSKREKPTWVMVDLAFVSRFARPVTLEDVRAEKALADMALLRISRLSVQPVTADEWAAVLRLAGR